MARLSRQRDVISASGLGSHHTNDPIAGSRGEVPISRQHRSYWCRKGHGVTVAFAADVPAPTFIECRHCGSPAGLDRHHPPAPVTELPYRTHLEYARARRSPAEAEALLDAALSQLPSSTHPAARNGAAQGAVTP